MHRVGWSDNMAASTPCTRQLCLLLTPARLLTCCAGQVSLAPISATWTLLVQDSWEAQGKFLNDFVLILKSRVASAVCVSGSFSMRPGLWAVSRSDRARVRLSPAALERRAGQTVATQDLRSTQECTQGPAGGEHSQLPPPHPAE